MKKYVVLFGAVILVMALASPSLAQFKSWGHMEIQTIWEKAPDFNTGQPWQLGAAGAADRDETWRHIAQRYRFYLQYGDVKTVRAVIGFEADSTDWGQPANTSATVSGGGMGVYRADQVQLEVKHAYLDFTIPNTPVMLTAGIFNFDIGGRMWMNNDAPGLMLTANFAPHKLRAFWWRENDQVTPNPGGEIEAGKTSRNSYSVNDTYGLAWDMTKQEYNLFAFAAYKNDLFTGNTAAESATFHRYDDHPWWVGVGGGWRPGNWQFSGEFIYAGGTRNFSGDVSDSDYEAWATEGAAKYRLGPGMFLGVEGFYSTGQHANKEDKIRLYPIPTGSEGQSIFGNDRTVFFWMNAAQMGYYHERNLAFMGMWYGRANFEYSPLAWLRFNLNYLYIGDNNEGNPGTGVNAFTGISSTKQVNAQIGARQDKDEDYVGQEVNLITSITIYPGFVYNIGLAVFFPGDVYNTSSNSPDNAYAVNTKLVYAF